MAAKLPAERVVAAYRKGETTRELAERNKVAESTIRRLLKTEGIERRRSGPRGRLDVSDDEIVRLHFLGLSWQQVADELGMSRTGVRKRWARINEGLELVR